MLTDPLVMQRQELESENKKLKNDLNELRKNMAERAAENNSPGDLQDGYNLLLSQLRAANEELDARKEEVLCLRTQIVTEAQQHEKLQQEVHSVLDANKQPVDADEALQAYNGLSESKKYVSSAPAVLSRPTLKLLSAMFVFAMLRFPYVSCCYGKRKNWPSLSCSQTTSTRSQTKSVSSDSFGVLMDPVVSAVASQQPASSF